MTDQTESASEYAEFLADLDAICAGMPNKTVQGIIYHAASAIRALEAKVRGMDAAVEWLERDRDLWHQRAKINEDRADKYAAQSAYLLPALSEARLRIEADRDRLAGEVERLTKIANDHAGELDSQGVALIQAQAEVARLTSELAETREIIEAARPIAQHGTCATREEIANLAARFAAIDAAGGEG